MVPNKRTHLPTYSLLPLLFFLLETQPAASGFIRTSGLHFHLDGSPFLANGFNAYWLMFLGSKPSQRHKVTIAFRDASARGLTVARGWAFSDGGYSPLQSSPGVYNEHMFRGLDFVVSEAGRHGVKLILSLVNNYESLGGKKKYVQWARERGRWVGSDDGFFTDPLVKSFYKNHLKAVLTRINRFTGVAYKDDPTIFAWELMNEPRCQSDKSGRTIQAWIREMAAHAKSIDRNHLIEAGLEGFYGPQSSHRLLANPGFQVGTDFIANNQIPGIDFATLHSYPDQWMPKANERMQLTFLSRWIDIHIHDAHNVLRKPLLLTEFGKSRKDSGFSNAQRDALFRIVYSKIYRSARTGGPCAGGLFWQLLTQGMDSYGDGYEVILGNQRSTTAIITWHSRHLRNLGKLYARKGHVGRISKVKAERNMQKNNQY